MRVKCFSLHKKKKKKRRINKANHELGLMRRSLCQAIKILLKSQYFVTLNYRGVVNKQKILNFQY